MFVVFFHSSHADIPKSCIIVAGGQLDDVIACGIQVLYRSECGKGLLHLHMFMVCLCPPEPHYRRGGESGGGSILRWSEQEALAVEGSATVYHVSAGCPPGLEIHTGQSPPRLYSVVWYIHVCVLNFPHLSSAGFPTSSCEAGLFIFWEKEEPSWISAKGEQSLPLLHSPY